MPFACQPAWIAVLFVQITLLTQPTVGSGNDLETIRSRLVAPLLTTPDPGSVAKLISSMQPDGTWADIDYDDKNRSSWSVPAHLSRVAALARAYRAPGSTLQGDRDVLEAALDGLDGWLRLDPRNPNWWWNQIGVPKSLLPILLLLDEELSDSQREAGLKILRRAQIGMTGQNLVWVTAITAGRGLLENDTELIAKAYERIAEEISVGMGEGIQPDFSFHQHGPCLYNHGYGAAFIVDCSQIAALLKGTAMALPREKIEILTNLILDGTQWMTHRAATDFGAEGREITRKGQSTSHLVSAAKSMLQLSTGREDEFRTLLARAGGRKEARPLVGNRHFWRGDMMTHHRPGYYASVRMHSTRLANTDGPANNEGLLSHHLADGCFVLMQTGREYHNLYGVWDWQKIPGTTVRQKPALKGSPRRMGTTAFVGGVSDGTYGLATFDFERKGLVAKKSWFFCDNEIVCLGAGITSEADGPVLTTLNQCYLNGDVILADVTGVKTLARGDHATATPQWLWHDSVGYVVVQGSNLHLHNDGKAGSWHASNRRYPDHQETRDLFSAWIDHGTTPQAADYAYVVVPGIKRDEIVGYASETPLRVVGNCAELQAVVHEKLGLLGAAFYQAGAVEFRAGLKLAVDTPCLLLAREEAGKLRVTVSNPRTNSGAIRVTVTTGQSEHRVTIQLPTGSRAGSGASRTVAVGSR